MKKEATAKNKKWLWLVIALVAILAVAGVLVAILMGGDQNSGDATPTSKLYWNVDRKAFTEELDTSETGLTTRERGEDGLYHFRMATGGELIEVLVSDARLANYIDTLNVLGLVFDADGMVVDALDPSTFSTEIAVDFYVKSVTDTAITVNSSVAMNGLDLTFDISNVGVYDVSSTAAQPGMPAVCGLMDCVYVYGDLMGNPTDIFITERAPEAEVYWSLPGFYDETTKETTRIPDENGVYTLTMAYKGELVEVKCKDRKLVTKIDKSGTPDRSWALQFDEEGYAVSSISTQMALRGILLTDRYNVDSWDGKTFHATGYVGATAGKEATATLADDCEIYLVCANNVVKSHIGEKTELQLYDRILCFTDLEGKAKLIYVLNRLVDSELYFNLARNYNQGMPKRYPDENGYYNIQLASNGKVKTYRTKDINLVNEIDAVGNGFVGLKLRGDIIEMVYDFVGVTGLSITSYQFISDMAGSIISLVPPSNVTNVKNVVVPANAQVYNVTKDMDGTKIGSSTTLKKYDMVSVVQFLDGRFHVYVQQRYVPDAKLYYNLEPQYNSKTGETKRVPNEEGYYVFNMATDGKQVQVKTKNKDMATMIDSSFRNIVALKMGKDGVVKYAYKGVSVAKGGELTSANYFFDKFEDNEYKCYAVKETGNVPNGTKIYKGSKAPAVYNVTFSYEQYIGEKSKLKKDDKVLFIIGKLDNNIAHSAFITLRKIELSVAYKKDRKYNETTGETTRVPDADGYYVFEMLVDGVVKQCKTKDKALASKVDSYDYAFGVKLKGDIIQSTYTSRAIKGWETAAAFAHYFDVTAIEDDKIVLTRNRAAASNYGEVRESIAAKKYQVYDLSPYAKEWGAKTKLKVGDRVIAYRNEEKELHYFFVMYACTRKEGPISHCDHCDKEVWWEPFLGEDFKIDGVHYYYPTDTTTGVQFVAGALEKPVLKFRKPGVVNVYEGVTLTGEVDDSNGTLNHLGASEITEQANKMEFPDVAEYEAYCPACKKDVTWHGVSSTSRIRAVNGDHQFLRANSKVTQEYAVINSNPAELGYESLCVHLNGMNLTSISSIMAYGGTLNIMGTGTVSSSCMSTTAGDAAIYVYQDTAIVNLYGGEYISTAVDSDAAVILDLNGKEITVKNRIATVYGSLDIYDTVGGGAFNIKNADKQNGCLIVSDGGVINLHSGTVKVDKDSVAAGTGGIVSVNKGGTFNMLGGVITGGNAEYGGNVAVKDSGVFNLNKGTISNGTASAHGGNVYIKTQGTFNMNGGKIVGGTSPRGGNISMWSSLFNLKNGTITKGVATNTAGNVFVLDESDFIMTGGEITNGNAKNGGGNVCVQATNNLLDANGKQVRAKLEISGGTISGGASEVEGGNIFISNHGDLIHTGGKVTGGTAGTNGSNIKAGSASAKLSLGATATGGDVYTELSGTVTLTNKAVIDTLVIGNGATIELGELKSGAKIKLSADGVFTVENDKAKDYASYFTAVSTGKIIKEEGKVLICDYPSGEAVQDHALTMSFPTDADTCEAFCPACNRVVTWKAVNNGENMSAAIADHWFLAEDITYNSDTDSFVYKPAAATAEKMCIHLNGKTVTTNTSMDASKLLLTILGDGTINGTGASNGKLFSCGSDSKVRLYGGTYNYTGAEGNVLYCDGLAEITVYDRVTLNGNVHSVKGSLNLSGAAINGKVIFGNELVLSGNAAVTAMEPGLTAKLTVKETWTGAVAVDFQVYEQIAAEPGFGLVYANNAAVEGTTLGGTLTTAAGKTYALTADGRLKVETDKFAIAQSEIAAVAENMVFPENVSTYDAFCPACNKLVTWKSVTTENARVRIAAAENAHRFLAVDINYVAESQTGVIYALADAANGHTTACVHLNGRNINSKSEILADGSSMVLSILGNGKVQSTLDSTTACKRFVVYSPLNGNVVNLYGGTYESLAAGKPAIGAKHGVVNIYGKTAFTAPNGTDLTVVNGTGAINDYRWSLSNDGILTITGKDAMADAGWLANKEDIKTLVIGSDVTAIAENAFAGCVGLKTVELSAATTSVGNGAFTGCTALTNVTFGGSEEQWNAISMGTGNEALTGSAIDCHIHSYTVSGVTAPTCTEKGYTTYTCACGHTYNGDETPAAGHGAANAEGKCPTCGVIVDVAAYAKTMVFPTDGSDSTQLCPHCNEVVTWKAVVLSGDAGIKSSQRHMYLPGTINVLTTAGPAIQVRSDLYLADLCLHLNGKTINAHGGIEIRNDTNSLNIMGAGVFNTTGTATKGWGDFGIQVRQKGTINLYGGRYVIGNNKPMFMFREVTENSAINIYGETELVYTGDYIKHYTGNNQSLCTVNDYRTPTP